MISTIAYHLFKYGKIDCLLYLCKYEGSVNTKLEILRFFNGLIDESDIKVVTERNIEDFFDKKILIMTYNNLRMATTFYHGNVRVLKKVSNKKTPKKINKPKHPTKSTIRFDQWGSKRMIVCDEGQLIKNATTQIFNCVNIHKEFFEYRSVLSGTLGYKVTDYYSICKFLSNEIIPYSHSVWLHYMEEPESGYKHVLIPERVKEFKERVINKFIFSVPDCLKAPPLLEKKVFLDMSKTMVKKYQQFINSSILKARENNGGIELKGKNFPVLFPYLLQFTSSPALLSEEFGYDWDIGDDPKFKATLSLLENWIDENKQKVIIWTGYPNIGNLLKEKLSKYKPLVITGDLKNTVKMEERFEEVQKWRADPFRNLAIFSYVLSTSINIPEVNKVLYWDVISDADPRNQSKGRTRRATSTEQTEMIHLIYDKSVDVYVTHQILQTKTDVKNLMNSNKDLSLDEYKLIFNASAVSFQDGIFLST
jgi:hypothetical protein